MIPGIVYSWSWTIHLDELEMYQFFAILSYSFIYILNYIYTYNNIDIYTYSDIYMYFFIVADVNLMAAHRCDSVMTDTDSDHDSGMAKSDSDEYDSEVELEIAIAYVQLCIEYVQKYYMKRPMCTSILSGRS